MGPIYRCFVLGPLRDLARRPAGQIPALDALRTCAVMMVLCGHVCEDYAKALAATGTSPGLGQFRAGWMGVDLFFVLSGYFIGRQLWRELNDTGTIDFGRFVLRRGFRIWPLYFFFLAFVVVVLGRGSLPFGRGWSDLVFLTNYFIDQGAVKGSWSLCTEEQFYTLAPLLLILAAPRVGSAEGFRKVLVAILLLEPLVRAVSWWRLTGSLARHDPDLFVVTLYQPIHSHADGLIMGLLIANLELTGGGRPRRGLFATPWGVLLAVAAAAALRLVQREVFNFTGVSLIFGATVWFLLAGRRGWLRPLDAIPFYWLSRLSFGMYLNHGYIAGPLAKAYATHLAPPDRSPAHHGIALIGITTVLSAAAALLTFCLIEHPFLSLRHRMLERARSRTGKEDRVEGGGVTSGA